jgi:phospholipid/cholesterol/gamma-HCH transport system substrate-binding protein
MNASFKVGLITILTVMTLMVGVIFIWQINPYAFYQISGYFPHVGGIKAGSKVTLMGVEIGDIVAVVAEPDKRRVKILMNIKRDIKLPLKSTFTIVTTGLVGDKNVEVLPPDKPGKAYLESGSEISGTPPASLDAIFTEAQAMIKSARELVDNPQLRNDITQTVGNVNKATFQLTGLFQDIKKVTSGFGKLTDQTDILLRQINSATAATIPEVQHIIASTRRIAGNIEGISGSINDLAHDRQLIGDTRQSIQNVNGLTRQWQDFTKDLQNLTKKFQGIADDVNIITGDVKEISHDPEIKGNIRTVAKNATRLTNAIFDLTNPQTQTNQWDLNLRAETLGAVRLNQEFKATPGAVGNFNVFGDLGLGGPVSYFRVGLDEIGDGNLINLQAGSQVTDNSLLRFGLVRGKLGAGADFSMKVMDQPLTLTGELYDINSPRMRLGVLQNIWEDYGLSLYWDNQFVRGINEFNLGFRWQPRMGQKQEPVRPPR